MNNPKDQQETPMPKGVTLLTDHDIAKLFKVSLSTVYRWRKQKLLPHFEMGVNSYYVQEVIVPLLLAKGSKGLQAAPVENN
ncbi:helix-turn-helix domain-containing protein [Marixanthomonas sp. SCSIO 43207]|uniref:helix-turn-helix domain-containing protein n=1 Tax=Marixanthomonas sp. SCSIO 43207 TaxID=2779360 RepID=UPI001CA7FD14|nr:helix-turn-helix domain-containing protein [Marixanthomonas sp. SCSIO 43207]UAB80603.1 helix-turn-helix domain-containing protein [Marixanthomonas sp. SCSIO 43207]